MADEKPFENVPENPQTPEQAVNPEPIAEDLNDSDLEEASGGAALEDSSNVICGFGC